MESEIADTKELYCYKNRYRALLLNANNKDVYEFCNDANIYTNGMRDDCNVDAWVDSKGTLVFDRHREVVIFTPTEKMDDLEWTYSVNGCRNVGVMSPNHQTVPFFITHPTLLRLMYEAQNF